MSAQHSEHSAASQIRQFKAAELVLREDILAKTKELADLLASVGVRYRPPEG